MTTNHTKYETEWDLFDCIRKGKSIIKNKSLPNGEYYEKINPKTIR